jgi:isoquinoline 1-oxidoreductase
VPAFTVNGVHRELALEPDRSLLHVLREELHLTGAKYACGEGACGACTVLVDGDPVRACVTPVGETVNRSVTTVEGLAPEGSLHPVQRAFLDTAAMQCGYCTPGMIMNAVPLVGRIPAPDDDEIAQAMQGNICRCCAYPRIARAIRRAADLVDQGPVPASSLDPFEVGPARPWDLTPAEDRDYFEVLGPGLVVVVPPDAVADAWSAIGGAWIHVDGEGLVTAFTGKVDVGQDNRTGLSILVAEELCVPLTSVRLVMGDTDLCPADMGTFGSRSTPDAGAVLQAAAAAARRFLDEGIERGARRVKIVTDLPPLGQDAREARTSPGRVGAADIVTGARGYTSDVDLPGMLHGARLRPPAIGASLRSVDVESAERIPGVTVVRDGELVAVAAEDPMTARHAVAAIHAEWDLEPQPAEDQLEAYLRSHPAKIEGWGGASLDERGDVDAALAGAEIRIEETYTTAYLAHAPLETRVAVARWAIDQLVVWTGTQVPFGVRFDVAERLGLDEARVRVIVPAVGGGFGGKHSVEAAVDAAVLARATGRPVKVRWSREEEFLWGYVRPAAVIDVRGAISADGALLAWDFRTLNAGGAGLSSPYATPTERLAFQPTESPLAQGSYRALAATANNFARESHIDELAAACGVDPLTFRLRHLSDERLAAVLRAAADEAGWAGDHGGAALGIACGVEKDARVATCVQLRMQGGRPRIERIVTVVECGAVVDPDNLVNQIEGATVMGLGGALFEAVHFADGRITNASMTDYRVPRFADAPPVDVIVLDRPDLPAAGAGETPIIAVAPAIANAIFAASGERLRSLPLLAAAPR